MRLCYLGDAHSIHLQRWTTWFARRGHDVHVASCVPAEIPGVQVHVLPFRGRAPWALPLRIARVRRVVSDVAPDLLHAHQTAGYGLWGAFCNRHPYVVSAWGSDVLLRPQDSWLQERILRFVIRRADHCIPVAQHLEDRMRTFGLDPRKSTCIPMGVDLEAFPPVPQESGERPVGFASTRSLEPVYDVETVVRAAKTMRASRPDVRGVVLGDGSLRRPLEALAAELNLRDVVTFEGQLPQERVMARLAETRAYVSTSRSDGASVSLLEAMSRGCFPVVSDIPANRPWIADGENGLLFPVGDADALARALLAALADDGLRVQASRRNIERVRRDGDLGTNLARVESLYRSLVDAPRS